MNDSGHARYTYDFADGSREMADLLGGKGANLAEMVAVLGADRVPAGFTITTEACLAYLRSGSEPAELAEQVRVAIARLEQAAGSRLGDAAQPLLVSVRSGAPISMPGMMDTVLNLGLNDESVLGLAERTGNPRFAWDCYRRLCQMFGQVVRGVPGEEFESMLAAVRREQGVRLDSELDPDELRRLSEDFRERIEERSGAPFPQSPQDQLREAIQAVFRSWQAPRAVEYRRIHRIADDMGTAVNVQQMVFGNTGERSGSGVAFSRDELTGAPEPSGSFLQNAQGEDVVSGTRNTKDLDEMRALFPELHAELLDVLAELERHYRDIQDVEFTIEDARLFLLQTRNAKRSAQAAVRFAGDIVDEGLLSEEEALRTLDPDGLEALLHPTFEPGAEYELLTRGVAASPGVARGEIAFTAAEAISRAGAGAEVILVRPFTEADDVAGFHAARGILTSEGGRASHAALVARGMGRPCVAGASKVRIDLDRGQLEVNGTTLSRGQEIAIDGSTGAVTADEVPMIPPQITEHFGRVLSWADRVRRMGVRANADTPIDAARAVELGAEGIGLCRTEHMFFGQDRDGVVREMFIAAERWRRARLEREGSETLESEPDPTAAESEFKATLDELKQLQRGDFEAILEAMGSRPVTIRLLDPPLHEFLPVHHFEAELEQGADRHAPDDLAELEARLELARGLGEANPMLGTRGARLGILYPPIYEMQVTAVVEAASEVRKRGIEPRIELMLPLIAYEGELRELRARVETAASEALRKRGLEIEYSVGTMLELPRACLVADRIAPEVEFFSFGTNDLTQTAIGLSRDDVESSFMSVYLDLGILDRSPFETLDEPGVGALLEVGAERGRAANPDLKLGVCGEHGGDPKSIGFLERLGLDYVSCSPTRVPVARIAAAQATMDARSG